MKKATPFPCKVRQSIGVGSTGLLELEGKPPVSVCCSLINPLQSPSLRQTARSTSEPKYLACRVPTHSRPFLDIVYIVLVCLIPANTRPIRSSQRYVSLEYKRIGWCTFSDCRLCWCGERCCMQPSHGFQVERRSYYCNIY